MSGKIVVITGASSGFGRLASLEFAKKGYKVIATMRNVEKSIELLKDAEELDCDKNIQIEELDVTSEKSIQTFKVFLNLLGKVDVLINNAGYAAAGFVEEIPISEYRKQFETNFFGLIAVTQACLPLMRHQGKGKIINISSISGLIGFPGLSPYVASKHALEGFTECLRLEMQPFGIDVSLVEPGSFKTNIWSTGKQVTLKSLEEGSPYYSYMRTIESHIEKGENQFGDPKDVALKIVEIAEKQQTTLRYPIGKGVKISLFLKKSIVWRSWERLFLKRMV